MKLPPQARFGVVLLLLSYASAQVTVAFIVFGGNPAGATVRAATAVVALWFAWRLWAGGKNSTREDR